MPTEAAHARMGKGQHKRRCQHEDVSRMAERTAATGRAVAQHRWQAERHVACQPAAERFSGQQELEQKAQAATVRRAGVQAVEACGASQAATIQTGTACEDRDTEAVQK